MTHVVIKVARKAGIIALFIMAAMLGILSGVLFAYAGDLPQVSALDNYSPSTITRIYSSGGQVIGEFATQRRMVVGYDDINRVLREAMIATGDAEFDRHFGVNIWRIFVAAVTDVVERRRAQGASTLTQQLARNLKDQFGLTAEKSFERKIREAILAIQIEKRYTKKEIFTIYCNQMYLGHGAYGVEAASRLYFQKSNKQLSLEEAALIAGIFQTPERQSPFVDMKRATQRRNLVLQRMADERYITQVQADTAKQKPIVTRGQPNQPPGAARLRIGRFHADIAKDGFAWTHRASAADLFKPGDLVEVAVTRLDEASSTATATLEQTPAIEGAILAIENRTGQIKAMVGGWSFSRSKFNRAVQAYRQLGSTFKPIVYTAAIDRGFTPTSILQDSPVSYSAGNGQIYSLHNYDHLSEGPITLRHALEESRNVPAIRMMDALGAKNVLGYAKRFGFEVDFPPYLPI